MINEHSSVVLTEPISKSGLEAGDVGIVVHIHDGGEAYEVEFVTLAGTTRTIETLSAHQVRAAGNQDILHVRKALAA
jgi:hypothetical protein